MNNLTTNYISKKYLFLILLIINVTVVVYMYEDEMRILTVQMKITEFNKKNQGIQNITYDEILIENEIINIKNISFKNNNMNLTVTSSNLILKNKKEKLNIELEDIKINNDFLFNYINKIANKNIVSYVQIEEFIKQIGKIGINLKTNLNGFVSFEIINEKIGYNLNYNISLNKEGLLNKQSFLNMFFLNKNIVDNEKTFKDILDIDYSSLKSVITDVNKKDKFFNINLINNLFNEDKSLFIDVRLNKIMSISDFANTFVFNNDSNNTSLIVNYSKNKIVKDNNKTIQNIQNIKDNNISIIESKSIEDNKNDVKIISNEDDNISIIEDKNETK